MRLPFFKSSRIGDSFLTVDVGSHSVKVCVCENSEDALVHITGFGECVHTEGDIRLGAIHNARGVIDNIKAAVAEAQTMASKKPKNCVLGVSGEVSHGLTTVVRLHRAKSNQPITESELTEMDYRVEETAQSEAQTVLSQEFGYSNIPIEIISTSVTNYKIDGTTFHNPLGKMGGMVDIYSYSAFVESTTLAKLQKVVHKAGPNIVCTTSTIFSIAQAVSRRDFDNTQLIIVDIGGELTQVAIIIEGGIVSQTSYPIGSSSITRGIMKELNLSFDDSELIKYDFSSGGLDDKEVEQVKEAVSSVLKLWVAAFNMALAEMQSVQCFPYKIYLTGGGATFPLFKKALSTIPWSRDLAFDQEPEIAMLEFTELISVANDLSECPRSLILPASLGVIGSDLRNMG